MAVQRNVRPRVGNSKLSRGRSPLGPLCWNTPRADRRRPQSQDVGAKALRALGQNLVQEDLLLHVQLLLKRPRAVSESLLEKELLLKNQFLLKQWWTRSRSRSWTGLSTKADAWSGQRRPQGIGGWIKPMGHHRSKGSQAQWSQQDA